MIHINWDTIPEKQPGDFNNPVPGGYLAMILHVTDNEKKERLEIQWDFMTGEYKGSNQDTFSRAGFWPNVLWRSYKPAALGFFKAFKTAVEKSNNGYVFDDYNIQGLVGKRMGVVLGEEEYRKNNGEIGKRLYVYQVLPVESIQQGNFKVPELKLLGHPLPQSQPQNVPAGYSGGFYPLPEESGCLPF